MTNEEAIKILKLNATLAPKATQFCEAVKIAVDAIEKQIPQKAHRIEDEFIDYTCPACGNPYISENYCGYCGQRLKWEGIEE